MPIFSQNNFFSVFCNFAKKWQSKTLVIDFVLSQRLSELVIEGCFLKNFAVGRFFGNYGAAVTYR